MRAFLVMCNGHPEPMLSLAPSSLLALGRWLGPEGMAVSPSSPIVGEPVDPHFLSSLFISHLSSFSSKLCICCNHSCFAIPIIRN